MSTLQRMADSVTTADLDTARKTASTALETIDMLWSMTRAPEPSDALKNIQSYVEMQTLEMQRLLGGEIP